MVPLGIESKNALNKGKCILKLIIFCILVSQFWKEKSEIQHF